MNSIVARALRRLLDASEDNTVLPASLASAIGALVVASHVERLRRCLDRTTSLHPALRVGPHERRLDLLAHALDEGRIEGELLNHLGGATVLHRRLAERTPGPQSVFVWHGEAWPLSLELIAVDGRALKVTLGYKLDPNEDPRKFYVLYFREPEGYGEGRYGEGRFGG